MARPLADLIGDLVHNWEEWLNGASRGHIFRGKAVLEFGRFKFDLYSDVEVQSSSLDRLWTLGQFGKSFKVRRPGIERVMFAIGLHHRRRGLEHRTHRHLQT